jgi:hypothetical protein
MIREEQNVHLSREYAEAIRYMDNANGSLQKSGKDGNNYIDKKYVRTACGTAYNGVLLALDAWFVLKGIPEPPKKQHKSIKYYMSNIAKIDKKLVSDMDTVYDILHLEGYYRGITNIKIIAAGFELAYEIIERIKPEHPVEVKETRAQGAKRVWDNIMVFAAVMFS